MPLYQTITYTTNGTKQSLNMDPSAVPFNTTVVVTLTAGTTSYKLQYSITPFDIADSSANWNDSVDIPAGTSTSASTSLAFPVSRIRLVIASLSGGNLVLETSQGFSTN